MKNIFFLLGISMSLFTLAKPQFGIVSQEQTPHGNTFSIQYFLKSKGTLSIQDYELNLPSGVRVVSTEIPTNVLSGDSISLNLNLTYDPSKTSFFAQTICLQLELVNGKKLRNDAMVYFTPWKTVETWSHAQYYGNPVRKWFSPLSIDDSLKVEINKTALPVSDVDFSKSYKEGELEWVRVAGLAYQILMTTEKAQAYPYYPGDDQPTASNARVAGFLCSDRDGKVRGRLVDTEVNDLGISRTFPLEDIFVRLRDDDPGLDDQLGSTFTDENGFFEIAYESCQNEGKLELFLEFRALGPKGADGQIEVLNKANILGFPISDLQLNLDGSTAEERVSVGSVNNNFFKDMGDIQLRNKSFTLLHRAIQCRKFSKQYLPQSTDLDIIPFQEFGSVEDPSSFYLPDVYVLAPITPKIVLVDGDEIGETTIYHEYGHHYFHMLTGYATLPLYYNKVGNHGNRTPDHPYGVFNEGWADAFHYMMDAHRYREDLEYGFDDGAERFAQHEFVERFNLFTNGILNFTSGFESEYLIGLAIYDLWDGADKSLPSVARFDATGGDGFVEFSGFNDVNETPNNDVGIVEAFTWNQANEEDVSLSFAQIAKGLIGNPTNVYDYFRRLILHNGFSGSECGSTIHNIEKVFRNNWVVEDIPAYRDGLGTDMVYYDNHFSTTKLRSDFGYVPNVNKTWSFGNLFQNLLFMQYKINEYNWGEQNTIEPGDFLTVNERYERITQPLLIDREDNDTFTRTLTFTGAVDYELCNNLSITVNSGILDLQNQGQFIISQNAILEANNSFAEIIVRENTQLIIYDKGILRLNGDGARLNLEGDLHIYPGGTLSIDGQNAGINVRGNGKIIIHPGAYVCVDDDTHMSFSKSMAEQLGFSTYHLGVHPDWQNQFGNVGCWKITYALASNLGLQLVRTNQISCNNTNFGYQITGPQLPPDAQICWYFPSTWSSWVTAQNCTPWVTTADGTVNNWQQGNYQGGEVSVIVKANGKIQELTDFVFSSSAPQLAVIAPANFTGELNVCDNNSLIVQASNTTSPYTFTWKNHWNLNHDIKNEATKSTLTLKPEQWIFDLQTFEVTAKDTKGCISNKVQMSVRPSINEGWIPRPLNYPESVNKTTLSSVGRLNNDFALSKNSERIYFTDNANNLRYYTFDLEKLKWVFSEVLAPNSAGSVELVEDESEAVVYFKSVSKKIQSVRYDKVSKVWSTPITYSITNNVSSHVFVNNQKQLFYRNTANELIRVLPNNSQVGLATDVSGVNLLQVDQKLFYTTNDGQVNYIDLTTNQSTRAVGLMAKNETMIKADSEKNIYYINTNNDFQQIPFDGTNYGTSVALSYKQLPSKAWKACTGYFDINKKSDVIYYNGSDRNIYQLYLKPTGEWESVLSNNYANNNAYGYIEYRYPHAFYMSQNYLYNLYYTGDEGCYVLQRKGESNFKVDESISFVTYPNPTYDRVTIQLEEKIQSGKVELISGIGEVILSDVITNNSMEWDLEFINSGLYLVVLKDLEGTILQSEKLMVVE